MKDIVAIKIRSSSAVLTQLTKFHIRAVVASEIPSLVQRGTIYFVGIVLISLLPLCVVSAQNQQNRIRNIVLVHGAWADSSGWRGVYDILVKYGYRVSIVQEPETSFKEDVAAEPASWVNKMGRAFLLRTVTGERSSRTPGIIRQWLAWCISRHTCRMPAKMNPTSEDGSPVT
jgi:hypothetical protein